MVCYSSAFINCIQKTETLKLLFFIIFVTNCKKQLIMNLKLSLLIICLYATNSYTQIKAVTESGDEVVLFDDNTWKYIDDSLSEAKEIPTNNFKFRKDRKATFLVKSKRIDIGIWLNTKEWSFKKAKSNEAAELTFELKNGDLYAMIISEKAQIPLLSLRELAISNAKEVAPDVKIDSEEYRTINGTKILMLQMSGTTQGVKFKYYSYYYSSSKGVAQIVTYTALNLFEDYKDKMERLLNGFMELN